MPAPRFKIQISRKARSELSRLGARNRKLVGDAISDLAGDPYPQASTSLKGPLSGLRRLRKGDFRIIYQVKEKEVLVLILRVGDRKEISSILRRMLGP